MRPALVAALLFLSACGGEGKVTVTLHYWFATPDNLKTCVPSTEASCSATGDVAEQDWAALEETYLARGCHVTRTSGPGQADVSCPEECSSSMKACSNGSAEEISCVTPPHAVPDSCGWAP